MSYPCEYVYNIDEVKTELADRIGSEGYSKHPTDDDVDDCMEYLYDRFAELFYDAISDFVDENYDRWEDDDE